MRFQIQLIVFKKKNGTKWHRYFGGEQGIFSRHSSAYRLALLVATSAKTVHRTVFFRKLMICSLLVRIHCTYSYQKTKPTPQGYRFYFWRRARDSNPRNRFSSLHDFQSCSFDQLGQLSVSTVMYYILN